MLLQVVTTCSAAGYKEYGHRFLESFYKNWPVSGEVDLLLYTDGFTIPSLTAVARDLEESSSWLGEFKARHQDEPASNGQTSQGYRYRWDAVKFAHKVAAVLAADRNTSATHLLWLDADTITHSEVTLEAIESWLPDPAWLSWLDRDPAVINYPECGFLLFNRQHPIHRAAMETLQSIYENDRIFELSETHDSFVWQQLVGALKAPTRSMSGEGYRHLHVLVNGPLGAWFDHCKGPGRKKQGRTLARELRVARQERYWRT